MSIQCYKCQAKLELTLNANIPRSEECPKCLCDLRVCKMCSFYDLESYNECREPSADRIVEKEKANYCDYFKLNDPQGPKNGRDQLFNLADSLFKK